MMGKGMMGKGGLNMKGYGKGGGKPGKGGGKPGTGGPMPPAMPGRGRGYKNGGYVKPKGAK